jgi:SCF-associated factor 1
LVLIGGTDTTPEAFPRIKSELQNRSVISIAVGDFHFGVLTSSGKLLMWGQNSKGALGLGDPHEFLASSRGGPAEEDQRAQAHQPPTEVTVPTEVRFDHYERSEGRGRVERYCFAVIAGEHHTAALVVDLGREEAQPEGLGYHIQTPRDL